jgi:hypothetical protein
VSNNIYIYIYIYIYIENIVAFSSFFFKITPIRVKNKGQIVERKGQLGEAKNY